LIDSSKNGMDDTTKEVEIKMISQLLEIKSKTKMLGTSIKDFLGTKISQQLEWLIKSI